MDRSFSILHLYNSLKVKWLKKIKKEFLVTLKSALNEFTFDSIYFSGIISPYKSNISDVQGLPLPINSYAEGLYDFFSFLEELQS